MASQGRTLSIPCAIHNSWQDALDKPLGIEYFDNATIPFGEDLIRFLRGGSGSHKPKDTCDVPPNLLSLIDIFEKFEQLLEEVRGHWVGSDEKSFSDLDSNVSE